MGAAYEKNKNVPKRLQNVLSLADFEALAKKHLPKPLFHYISGAAEDNFSLQSNREAFNQYFFKTKVMVDVSERTQTTELFGHHYAAPFGIAPIGISAISAYQGDLVMALAAQNQNIPFIMSGSSLMKLETIAQACPQAWFQIYLPGDTSKIEALVSRIKDAKFEHLVVTVDIPVWANRENNVRSGFSLPLRPSLQLAYEGLTHPRWLLGTFLRTLIKSGMPYFENSFATRGAPILSKSAIRDTLGRDHLNWSHIKALRSQWPGKLIIKGLLHPADAKTAVDLGADGIIISNHGGRQLDSAVPPLYALPAIADAVGHKTTIMMDSGIRRGTDVIKALSLGAKAVLLGRPFMYAAAVGGQSGVEHGIELLKAEVDRNLAMLGVTQLQQLNPEILYYQKQIY